MARTGKGVDEPPAVAVERRIRRRGAARYCAAKHPCDGSLCDGDPNAVSVRVGHEEVLGCVRHAARLYASVSDARLRAVGGPDGPNAQAPTEVTHMAAGIKPFFWMHEPLTLETDPARARVPHSAMSPIRAWLHERSPWRIQ
jgi:hypothetical protein